MWLYYGHSIAFTDPSTKLGLHCIILWRLVSELSFPFHHALIYDDTRIIFSRHNSGDIQSPVKWMSTSLPWHTRPFMTWPLLTCQVSSIFLLSFLSLPLPLFLPSFLQYSFCYMCSNLISEKITKFLCC